MLRKSLLTVAAFVLVAVASCSNSPEVKEATGDSSASKPAAPKLSDADLEKFFEALGSKDPEEIEAAIPLAAEGSIAQAYAMYTLHSVNSGIDVGHPYPADAVTKSRDGFRVCSTSEEKLAEGEKRCYVWGDIESKEGKIASLTVDGEDLADRISLGTGEKVKLGPLGTVEFLSAYQTVSSSGLIVNLRVKTADLAVSGSSLSSARYRAKDGRQSSAAEANVVEEIAPNSLTYLGVYFDRAKPGGELIATFTDADFNQERDVTIPTR